ncbi:MAG: endopeptidase La [Bacteroidetes bacterium]|nr:endopeptidase La [Bacteroidota bacterium]MCL2303288.1 endopeptidase La [Lentimicrobiaceae bacterium]
MNEIIGNEVNFIPLFSLEDEEKLQKEQVNEIIPILPLMNTVLFPGMVIPITVGRNKSIKLAQEYSRSNHLIGVITHKDNELEEPAQKDLYAIGTLARIIKFLTMPDGSVTIIVQGIKRFELLEIVETEPYYKAHVAEYVTKEFTPELKNNQDFQALIGSIRDTAVSMLKISPNMPREATYMLQNIESPSFLMNFIASNLQVTVAEKQSILEIRDIEERGKVVLKFLNKDLQMLELKNQIQNKSREEIDKQSREYMLQQQMKTIQQELGGSPAEKDTNQLTERAKDKKWNEETKALFERELKKLQRTNPMSPDYSVTLNYLELMVDLPWNEFDDDNFDLKKAAEVLDRDHFGLEKVKERILEYLAVLKLKGDMKSPILCLAGPPGVGKTSLGKSIAEAIGRKYIRMSLGGLRDESEIRGHRKTYIGAMPGRIIQSMRKAGQANPVFVLDEIDKILGMNVQGDPSAALLEVLDPEQNATFYDNYLETSFDLSKVLFIATANNLGNIHPALLDRMEVIDIAGYLIEEKLNIAQKHLVPRQLKEHGMDDKLHFSNEVLERIILDYTRESGVRNLEKLIAKMIRKRASQFVQDGKLEKEIKISDLQKAYGAPIFQKERSLDNSVPGVATGLAWTQAGGEILFVESVINQGKNGLTMTGNLGEIMKESATIAYEYLKTYAKTFSIEENIFENTHIHLHVPEGATPKDGPSAGITILISMISAFTKKTVRPKIAMTAEITLRGKLLPVGGIKEKILAAKRSGIYNIILSSENKKDVEDIKEHFIEDMKFHYFSEMKEAVRFAEVV